MKFSQRLFFFVVSSAVAILLVSSDASAEFKKTKIAVLDFQQQGGGNSDNEMGKIVAEWVVTALVKEGRFDVIERRLLAKVLEEQKMGVSGIVDEESASKLGKVLGAKVVITGSILQFQDIVEVNARIIEVETSSIIAAESAKSTSAEKLEALVVEMTDKIIKDFPLEGYVVLRDNKTVLIDLGRLAGVKPGMRFVAYKEGRVIKHPKTGEVLDVETIEIGDIEITEVAQKTATGVILKESSPNAIAYGVMARSAVPGQLSSVEEERPHDKPVPVSTTPDTPRKKTKHKEKARSSEKVDIPLPTF